MNTNSSTVNSFLILYLVFCSQIGYPQSDSDSTIKNSVVIFKDVNVITMQNDEILESKTVIIRGGRIESIRPFDDQFMPKDATVIDGSGGYLIPGLSDMHVHLRVPFVDGPLYLNAGITTVLCMGPDGPTWEDILQERDLSSSSDFFGPRFYTVGRMIEGYASNTPDVVEGMVRESAEKGFDFVKIHGDLSTEAFERMHNTAKLLDIRVKNSSLPFPP